ncbi:MAG: hypothetical protein US42_C0018G0010 [Candidatus Magasanikbacteria bacterium GW2011_GWC2_37_14]|uniref:Uncharacterized protein n=1 Tax=Candidatus Magasanikbacteria bacterium GW2011_GWC2_37_14 TaxID=1619046 RepID=A0A0G0JFK9_9BACT|nr:MAG: hypothetical protein US42_C0018G0010 [Candidatus Magasanikbacteria bacterium GW2011_GWC2_37_14]
MSLVINITTPEGIVLAADSRQSYRNQRGAARIGSDNASKLFKINERIAIAATGLAFLPENGMMKNISKYIEQFKKSEDTEKMTVKEVAEKIHKYFGNIYKVEEQIKAITSQFERDVTLNGGKIITTEVKNNIVIVQVQDKNGKTGVINAMLEPLNFLLAGFNKNYESHEVYTCRIPGEIEIKRNSKEPGKEYGASWEGQNDVASRIVLGFDGRIGNIKFVQESAQKYGQEEINKQLRNLEYAIQWGTMTLQDAIDFSALIIKTTSAIQRFSDGIVADPGAIPGVGGPVDVAIIVPDKGFTWIKKKELVVEDDCKESTKSI